MRPAAVRSCLAAVAVLATFAGTYAQTPVPSPDGSDASWAAPDPDDAARLRLWRRLQDALPPFLRAKTDSALRAAPEAETRDAFAGRFGARAGQVDGLLQEIDDWDPYSATAQVASDLASRLRSSIAPLRDDLSELASYAAGAVSPYVLADLRPAASSAVLDAQRRLLSWAASWGWDDAWRSRSGSAYFRWSVPGFSASINAPAVSALSNWASDDYALAATGSISVSGTTSGSALFAGSVSRVGTDLFVAPTEFSFSAPESLFATFGIRKDGFSQLVSALLGRTLKAPLEPSDSAAETLRGALQVLKSVPAFVAQRREKDGSVSLAWNKDFLSALPLDGSGSAQDVADLLSLSTAPARRMADGSLRWEVASEASEGYVSYAPSGPGGWSLSVRIEGSGDSLGNSVKLDLGPSSAVLSVKFAGDAPVDVDVRWDGSRLDATASGTVGGKGFAAAVWGPCSASSARLAATLDGQAAGLIKWDRSDARETFDASVSAPAIGFTAAAKWDVAVSAAAAPKPPDGPYVEFGGFTDGVN